MMYSSNAWEREVRWIIFGLLAAMLACGAIGFALGRMLPHIHMHIALTWK
jgi:hypothetical protein